MRSILLSAALLTAAALTALTPGNASAADRPGSYAPYTYGGYYFSPGYYSSSPYYTNGGYDYAAPVVTYSYTVRYSAPALPSYISNPDVSAFTPVYSGPQYFHGYGPNRLWVYP